MNCYLILLFPEVLQRESQKYSSDYFLPLLESIEFPPETFISNLKNYLRITTPLQRFNEMIIQSYCCFFHIEPIVPFLFPILNRFVAPVLFTELVHHQNFLIWTLERGEVQMAQQIGNLAFLYIVGGVQNFLNYSFYIKQ